MKRFATCARGVASGLLLCFIMGSSAAAKSPAAQNKQREVIVRARDSYYSLKRFGLAGFRANIQPNWARMLEMSPQSSGVKLLNGLHFSIVFGADGNVVVNHETEVPPPNEDLAKRYNEIFAGIDKVMTGFFATWNLFMFGSPFPEPDSAYNLQDLGDTYVLTYKESNDKITTTFNKDFSIGEIQVQGDGFNGTINPELRKTARGYVLVGYRGTYVSAAGSEKTDVRNQLQYSEINGFQVPAQLSVDGTYNGGAVNMELAFSNYQISKSGTK